MSKSGYVTGLRAVEQLLASGGADIRRICVEYRTANPRVEAIIASAAQHGVDVQEANRARLQQMSGEPRHQGVVPDQHCAHRNAAARPSIRGLVQRQPHPALVVLYPHSLVNEPLFRFGING